MRVIGRALLGLAKAAAWLLLLGSVVLAALIPLVRRAEDLPWAPLRSLDDPVGAFTPNKLAALADDPDACRSLLARAGADAVPLPAFGHGPDCRVDAPVRLGRDAADPRLLPAGLVLSCPLAATLVVWERAVVQPAAEAIYGQRVAAVETFGSYSCRRIAGDADAWSEHATANAVDVAALRLADGHRVAVAGGWRGAGRDAAFLHRIRDGACRLFATVLSPDYNRAHRDHLHLDQAVRGRWGWRACR